MQCTLDCPRVHTSYLICMYAIFNLVLLLASRRASFTQVLYCTITQREYIHTYSVRRSVRQRARSGSARATRVQQCGAVPSGGNINITRVEQGAGSGSQHARERRRHERSLIRIIKRAFSLRLESEITYEEATIFLAIKWYITITTTLATRRLSLYSRILQVPWCKRENVHTSKQSVEFHPGRNMGK